MERIQFGDLTPMNATESRAPNINQAAKALFARTDFLGNPYLVSLRDGGMSLDAFQRSQEQFFYAVTFFPRPMAALVGRIPEPRFRLDILHNLVEEHGDFDERFFHHTTFQDFLGRLGVRPETLDSLRLWPEVRAFNSALTAACVLDELEVGVACMGMIEYAFADISADIGKGVVARGWLAPETLTHYKLHAEIDQRHADEFFAVIEAGWNDARKRYLIEQGLELGAYIFDRLYRDLHLRAERGR
jgi:pyrroloquinoline-quinone synthase